MGNIIQTQDQKMKKVLEICENIASSRASVLIFGESGTGKELLARYIHSKSSRASRSMIAINCAAVPDNLLESELFGYEKGAFTGADQRKIGKFELADGGSFLLDEISEMPLLLQAKLLRVIQEGEIERLGSGQPKKVNVRIIAATNKNLSDLVKKGQFREDLFYRLNVIPLEIPPLRYRRKDLEGLANYFVEMSCSENGLPKKKLGLSARQKILQWSWPGNVRELQNTIERSVLLTSKIELSAEEVLIKGLGESKDKSELVPGMTMAEAERNLIIKTLEFTEQNRTKAADMLGISIRTLRNKINEYKKQGYEKDVQLKDNFSTLGQNCEVSL